MEVDPVESSWVFRADFPLRAADELEAKRTILQLSPRLLAATLRRKIFGVPLSLCLSFALTGAATWYLLRDEALGKAILKVTTDTVLLLVVLELLLLVLLYAASRLARSKRPTELVEKLQNDRPVAFNADARGYQWKAPGTLLEGNWSAVDAVWNGKLGLAVIRGADIAFVPRHVFSTETAFVATVDTMLRLAKANSPIRIDA